MISFFKQIRKGLLNENKFSKYLIYAIGEITLVVIGILIALQLNNYNDNLKQKKLEHKSLVNLKLDFEFNLSETERNIKTLKQYRNSCLEILSYTGKNYSECFDLDNTLEQVVSTPLYSPQNGFLLELINSGNLRIIDNDELRNSLSSWLPTLEKLQAREQVCYGFNQATIQFIIKNGSWLNSDARTTAKEIRQINFPESGFAVNNNEMLQSLEFENLIENNIVNQTLLLIIQERCLKLNEKILMLLESEIKK